MTLDKKRPTFFFVAMNRNPLTMCHILPRSGSEQKLRLSLSPSRIISQDVIASFDLECQGKYRVHDDAVNLCREKASSGYDTPESGNENTKDYLFEANACKHYKCRWVAMGGY